MSSPLLVEMYDRLPELKPGDDEELWAAGVQDAMRDFRAGVREHYTEGTLARLLSSTDTRTRRAAVLALGLIGTIEVNPAVAAVLHDEDPLVQRFAADALWELWFRGGTLDENRLLRTQPRREADPNKARAELDDSSAWRPISPSPTTSARSGSSNAAISSERSKTARRSCGSTPTTSAPPPGSASVCSSSASRAGAPRLPQRDRHQSRPRTPPRHHPHPRGSPRPRWRVTPKRGAFLVRSACSPISRSLPPVSFSRLLAVIGRRASVAAYLAGLAVVVDRHLGRRWKKATVLTRPLLNWERINLFLALEPLHKTTPNARPVVSLGYYGELTSALQANMHRGTRPSNSSCATSRSPKRSRSSRPGSTCCSPPGLPPFAAALTRDALDVMAAHARRSPAVPRPRPRRGEEAQRLSRPGARRRAGRRRPAPTATPTSRSSSTNCPSSPATRSFSPTTC